MRSKLRRHHHSIARSKMITSVRSADVVVTNPTHFAVALRYDPRRDGAPRVVAKGVDALALRIRAEAEEHGVTQVEDPPLARYLHATCDVGEEIPKALYIAVAQLIAFIYGLDPVRRGMRAHGWRHSTVPELDPERPPPSVRLARQRRTAQGARRRSHAH